MNRTTTNRRGVRRHQLSVNNDRCRRYGTCEAEAPQLFRLMATGELFYRRSVAEEELEGAKAAARCCPMLAIRLEER
ncbi:MAG TPA: ferredoxin [Actinophytocola sp.]|uniref:ferredoxin n=1 Tax=Actinophytocola sp. TaxID=1872138 RepID=UPI002DDD512B|nr:ferredoxin [Actinophytocola sp.]HEV2783567.1 ferredoxin [Actinophytocola sp.]